MLERKQGIIFDLDGTVLNSTEEGKSRFIAIATMLGLGVDDEITAKAWAMWGVPAAVMISTCWPHVHPEIFITAWKEYDRQNPLPLFSGVKETLALLAARFHLSICTSRTGESTHVQLKSNDIDSLFSFVYTYDNSPAHKPDPESIRLLLEDYARHGISHRELVVVGDSVHSDYGLARAVGIEFIALTWGNNSRDDFLAAGLEGCRILDTIEDLLNLLCP